MNKMTLCLLLSTSSLFATKPITVTVTRTQTKPQSQPAAVTDRQGAPTSSAVPGQQRTAAASSKTTTGTGNKRADVSLKTQPATSTDSPAVDARASTATGSRQREDYASSGRVAHSTAYEGGAVATDVPDYESGIMADEDHSAEQRPRDEYEAYHAATTAPAESSARPVDGSGVGAPSFGDAGDLSEHPDLLATQAEEDQRERLEDEHERVSSDVADTGTAHSVAYNTNATAPVAQPAASVPVQVEGDTAVERTTASFVDVSGNAALHDVKVEGDCSVSGKATLSGVAIGGRLICPGGCEAKKVQARSITVAGTNTLLDVTTDGALDASGDTRLFNVTVQGKTSASGSLRADNTVLNQLFVGVSKDSDVYLTRSVVNDIVVEKDTKAGFKVLGIQVSRPASNATVVLDGTVVRGNVEFRDLKGTVELRNLARIEGNVIGGVIKKQ